MIVYVRAKKDRDAIIHVFENFYGYVPEVRTLGGVRGELEDAISSIPQDDFTLVLLGREDRKWVADLSNAWRKVDFFEKAKIRNGRQHQIYWFIERTKARFLLDVSWKETYLLGKKGFLPNVPGADVFIVFWEDYRRVLSEMLGRDVGNPLIFHKGNLDVLYSGDKILATLDRESLVILDRGEKGREIDIEDVYIHNREYLREKVKVTIRRVKEVAHDYEVILPFSGGKDSLTVYYLLKEAGIEFTSVFVDTGGEFEENRRIAEKVKAEIVEAPVAEKYRELGKEYLVRRECTRDKIGALYRYVSKNFERPLLVNGDRIAESRNRSIRPEFRRDEFPIFSPIKYWSYLDEQLYLYSKGIEMNKLYKKGFYRIGCVFCPFMDNFERYVLRRYTSVMG